MSPTDLRNIRVPDELWQSALHRARVEGRTLSEVIRDFLEFYVSTPPR